MKWSHHDRLSLFNVRLVGWPDDIPKQNPSSQSAKNNKKLLELVESGALRFEKLAEPDRRPSATSSSTESVPSLVQNSDLNAMDGSSSSSRSNSAPAPTMPAAAPSLPSTNFTWMDTSSPTDQTALTSNDHSIFGDQLQFPDLSQFEGAYQLNEFDPRSTTDLHLQGSSSLYLPDPHAQMLRYAAIAGLGRPVQYLDPNVPLDWPVAMGLQQSPRGVKRGREEQDIGDGSGHMHR